MRVITLATLGSLPRARALARSLRRRQASWPLDVVLVASDEVAKAASAAEEDLPLRSVSGLLELDLEALLALHDEEELTTLLLPGLLKCYAELSAEPVLHLPSSVWVMGELEPIEWALSERSVVLVPRLTIDVPDDALQPTREQMERVGRMEQTIIGIDSGAASSLCPHPTIARATAR